MRLNHKKSKVMHYRTVFGAVGEPEDAGYEAGGVRFEQPKAPTRLPPQTLALGGGNRT